MATPFREWPWPGQAVVYLIAGVVLVLLGLYLPFSPVQTERVAVDAANAQLVPLRAEVQTLRVYEQRRVELQSEMVALQKQLATLQAIVPEEKDADQFILMVQGAASASGVLIRKIVTEPVVAREYHYEMPFQISADGPYFAVMDFFSRLGRLSRIINVGDMQLKSVQANNQSFRMTPGTTVTGQFTITTFFTKTAAEIAENAKPAAPGKRR